MWLDGLENLEHMKILKYKLVISESAMNWGCIISLALHPAPSGLPPLILSCILCRVIISVDPLSPSPMPPTCSIPGPGDGTRQPISLLLISHNLASQLFQISLLRVPLWEPGEGRLMETHGTDPRPSGTSTHSFSGQLLLPLCQCLFHSGYWARGQVLRARHSQHLIAKM